MPFIENTYTKKRQISFRAWASVWIWQCQCNDRWNNGQVLWYAYPSFKWLKSSIGKLHHEIITLGLKLVSGKINGASLRTLSILRALIKFVQSYEQPSKEIRLEEDFAKKFEAISKFLRRWKPFTAGIEFAFTYIIESINSIVSDISRDYNLSEAGKLSEFKKQLIEAIKNFANM